MYTSQIEMSDFNYYYNNVPGKGLCRNNLIYTSLINNDQTVFVQWYKNDTYYHLGKNQVVDSKLMTEKFDREVQYLKLMKENFSHLIPDFEIDQDSKKIYLDIQGPDFWEQSGCQSENYYSVLPDWQDQMLEIIKAHKSLGLHKYSMHPSSYFIINGKLKSINYFFTYHKDEPYVSIKHVESHIHTNRQKEMKKYLSNLGIKWNIPQPWKIMDQLCWYSFSDNYPADFIQKCLKL